MAPPLPITFGAASSRAFGTFSASKPLTGNNQFIGILGSNATLNGYGVSKDSNNNIYMCGDGPNLAKYDQSGNLKWQRKSFFSSGSTYSVAVDSSNNIYVSSSNALTVAKYDANGTLQWKINLSGYSLHSNCLLNIDSSGNLYIIGLVYTSATSVYSTVLVKCNSSGAIQWQRLLTGSGTYTVPGGVVVDSSGNSYVCGRFESGLVYNIFIAKYNSSGVLQWQRSLSNANDHYSASIAIDSSANVYVSFYELNSSSVSTGVYTVKYNTSGTIQWQRVLGSSNFTNAITADSSGNSYFCGYRTIGASNNDVIIAKYNTSGVLQWQRLLGSSTVGDIGYAVNLDTTGNLCVLGASGTKGFLFAKLPNDGSKTGTYTVAGTSYIYQADIQTDSAGSLTNAASSLTDSAAILTSSSLSLSDSFGNLSSYITVI